MKKTILCVIFTLVTLSAGLFGAEALRIPAKGFAVLNEGGHFQLHEFTRHAVGDNEIQLDILYAGICHSDLHHVNSEWGKEEYPLIPGHEILGRVAKVGKSVTKFKVGDYAGVGCMIDSCHECEACLAGREQYCSGVVLTYHDKDQFHNNEATQGGYSNNYVLNADYAIRIPADADLKKVAPLLCAGITTYSPIRFAGVKRGDQVGIAGFGGLGHMGVKYAVALGADVTVFDVTEAKRADALRLGAARYVNVNNPEELQNLNNTFDFILSTIPANYDMNMYLKMLKFNGHLGIVGLPAFADMPTITLDKFIWQGGRKLFGSQIGGIGETQEMLDYSVAHNLYPEVELIEADAAEIDKAYQNVLAGQVKFRYVIDMTTLSKGDLMDIQTMFPLGEKLPEKFAQYFIGQAYLAPVATSKALNCPVSNVTFEPGCRNNWHRHSGGQLLLAVNGEGLYQERGKSPRLLRPGDTVEIAPEVEHWHGATAASVFSHLAVETNSGSNENTWLEPVGEAEYAAAQPKMP